MKRPIPLGRRLLAGACVLFFLAVASSCGGRSGQVNSGLVGSGPACEAGGNWTEGDGHRYSVSCLWKGSAQAPEAEDVCTCWDNGAASKSVAAPACSCCSFGSPSDACGSCVANQCGFPY